MYLKKEEISKKKKTAGDRYNEIVQKIHNILTTGK